MSGVLNSVQGHNLSSREYTNRGQLNPYAGTFQPASSQSLIDQSTDRSTARQALVMDDASSILAQLGTLRNAVADELCSLRRDVDMLTRGGWQLTIGPFQALQQADPNNVSAVRHRILSTINKQGDNDFPKAITDGVVREPAKTELNTVNEIVLRPSTMENR